MNWNIFRLFPGLFCPFGHDVLNKQCAVDTLQKGNATLCCSKWVERPILVLFWACDLPVVHLLLF